MTPNPHRGSDFADFLAEEDLMTPTMTPTKDLADALRFGLPMNPIEAVRVCNEAADRLEELEREVADLPERDRIKTVMTPAEIAAALESGDYSAEMLMQHLIRHHNRLERELEQAKEGWRDEIQKAQADMRRAETMLNDARAELAVWKHEAKRLEDQLKVEHETGISLFIELHELKERMR
jgi:hypothetical protein